MSIFKRQKTEQTLDSKPPVQSNRDAAIPPRLPGEGFDQYTSRVQTTLADQIHASTAARGAALEADLTTRLEAGRTNLQDRLEGVQSEGASLHVLQGLVEFGNEQFDKIEAQGITGVTQPEDNGSDHTTRNL